MPKTDQFFLKNINHEENENKNKKDKLDFLGRTDGEMWGFSYPTGASFELIYAVLYKAQVELIRIAVAIIFCSRRYDPNRRSGIRYRG